MPREEKKALMSVTVMNIQQVDELMGETATEDPSSGGLSRTRDGLN